MSPRTTERQKALKMPGNKPVVGREERKGERAYSMEKKERRGQEERQYKKNARGGQKTTITTKVTLPLHRWGNRRVKEKRRSNESGLGGGEKVNSKHHWGKTPDSFSKKRMSL